MNDPIPDDLRGKLSQLPRDIEPARDLWPQIRHDLECVSDDVPSESSSEVELVAIGALQSPPRSAKRHIAIRFALPLAAAATVAIAAFLLWPRPSASSPGWNVATLAGSPLVGDVQITGMGRWHQGEWLQTDAQSRARLDVGSIGEVQLEPGSRLRLVNASDTNHRLELARGTMSALIWAPPRLFFVETPFATAVDLGCAYTLAVDDDGAGILHVTSGYVALEHGDRESIIPAGLKCITRPGRGPGTPFAEDASAAFRDALDRFDSGSGDSDSALASLIDQSTRADEVTLWHLLARAPAAQRGAVFDRLAQFTPPPGEVTRDGIVAGHASMRDRWALELGLVTGR